MDQHETTRTAEPTERKAFGRRTVLKGAAWSVPAVVAVGATPAFAASLDFTFVLTPTLINGDNAGATVTASGTGVTGQTVEVSASGPSSPGPVYPVVDGDGQWTADFSGFVDGVWTFTATSQGVAIARTLIKDTQAPSPLAINPTTGTNPSTVRANRKSGTLRGTRGTETSPTADSAVTIAPITGFIFGTPIPETGTDWSISWTYQAAQGNAGAPETTFEVTQLDGAGNSSTATQTM